MAEISRVDYETVDELHDRMLQYLDDRYDKSSGSFYFDATRPIAIEWYKQKGKFQDILMQAFAVTATGKWLDLIAEDHGLKRASGESDESLRDRILQQKRNPERGGSITDYERWALSVTGCTYAKAIDFTRGIGTVDVVVGGTVADLIEMVQEVIDKRKPGGVDAVVRPVRMQTVPITVKVTGMDKEKAQEAITAFLRTIGVGGTLLVSRVLVAVIAAGATDASMITPMQNFTLYPDAQMDPVVTVI
ncbi:hypothetical protein BP422_13050 [Brevibacillus formosus]|uniref:Baseplate J-like central domain-containing protein n=1 Tax=Brevibacillus formosus TaxID=54913 RepID=A0A220MHU8_9BACL|nr:baseplate J/gp47 family protein [Brevibacillus formosus]ASJ54402.1 hypothetical protein BP422_13050 [Brevibacillus formosus]